MPYVKIKSYKEFQYSCETPMNELCNYLNISSILNEQNLPNPNGIEAFKCRTIGLLQSEFGRYFLKPLENTSDTNSNNIKLRLSVAYMIHPPKSTVIPYPVQVFGDLNFRFDQPILYAKTIKPLNINMALRLENLCNKIQSDHWVIGSGHRS